MIEREITPVLTSLFRQYPFVTVTGPRQSGKTTLCRSAFPDLEYVNLEAPDQRLFAESDPARLPVTARRGRRHRRGTTRSRAPVLSTGARRREGGQRPLRAHRQRAVQPLQGDQPVARRTHRAAPPSAVLTGRAAGKRGKRGRGRHPLLRVLSPHPGPGPRPAAGAGETTWRRTSSATCAAWGRSATCRASGASSVCAQAGPANCST